MNAGGSNVEATGTVASGGDEPRELCCQICRVEHEVWIAPSDVWNAVCRDGDRANPCKWAFLCPVCFMRLGTEMGLAPTGWLVTPEPGGLIRYASWLKIQPECDGSSGCVATEHVHGCYSERPTSTLTTSGRLPVPAPETEETTRLVARVEELTRQLAAVLEWPLPEGTVETWALPSWLAKSARAALEVQP